MTRRDLARLSLLLLQTPRNSPAQDQPYPGTVYTDYSRCLPDYLAALARQAREARNQEWGTLQYINKIYVRQRDVRREAWRMIGGPFERTPLETRVTGSLTRPGYRLDKLLYQSLPGMYVSANLYVPTVSGPLPAVLMQMGHAPDAKAYPEYQRCCQGLARLGFIVLAIDPLGQGERVCYPKSDGVTTRLGDPIYEHIRIGEQLVLSAQTITRYLAWDAIRGLDLLASHPQVDPKRIAITGHSGGGTMTMWLAALDERPAVAVPICAATENFVLDDFQAPGTINDAEQNLLDGAPRNVDRWDLLLSFAPKPMLVLVSALDPFSTYSRRYLQSGWTEMRQLRGCYELMNAAADLSWGDTIGPHALAHPVRMQLYRWLAKYLQNNRPAPAEEPPTEPEPESALWATPTGSVLRDLGSKVPRQVARPPVRTPDAKKLLRYDTPPAIVPLRRIGEESFPGYRLQAADVTVTTEVKLPLWIFQPDRIQANASPILFVDSRGRSRDLPEGGLYAQLARQGIPVASVDLRGSGDLAPAAPAGPAGYVQWRQRETIFAWASLVLGRPLLGQRVTDLLHVLTALRSEPGWTSAPYSLAARGALSVPALFTAAISRQVRSLLIVEGLLSYADIADREDFEHPFSNFVSGVLLETDLPKTAASANHLRLHLTAMRDGAGQPVAAAQVRSVYAACRDLTVSDQSGWTVDFCRKLSSQSG